jgi:uncharacterized membrane protein
MAYVYSHRALILSVILIIVYAVLLYALWSQVENNTTNWIITIIAAIAVIGAIVSFFSEEDYVPKELFSKEFKKDIIAKYEYGPGLKSWNP